MWFIFMCKGITEISTGFQMTSATPRDMERDIELRAGQGEMDNFQDGRQMKKSNLYFKVIFDLIFRADFDA